MRTCVRTFYSAEAPLARYSTRNQTSFPIHSHAPRRAALRAFYETAARPPVRAGAETATFADDNKARSRVTNGETVRELAS